MTTPITFLFDDVRADDDHPIDWTKLLTVYPALQQKRLTWRESDPRFAAFVSFLESDGVQSALAAGAWQAALAEHLAYPPNQHFLFMLWQSHLERAGENTETTEISWLPAAVGERFVRWREQIQLDRSLLKGLENVCQSRDSKDFPAFRGTPLSTAFMYQTLQMMIANQASQSNAQESQ